MQFLPSEIEKITSDNLYVKYIPIAVPSFFIPQNIVLQNMDFKLSESMRFLMEIPVNDKFYLEVNLKKHDSSKKIKTNKINSEFSETHSSTGDSEYSQDIPAKREEIEKTSPKKKESKTNESKYSMTQNYLPLTIQYFASWILKLPKTDSASYIHFLTLIGEKSNSIGLNEHAFEDKIMNYLKDKVIGKNGSKKKITNKSQVRAVLFPNEKDQEVTRKIKEVLLRMLEEFFRWPNFSEYLKFSHAGLKGKIFLLLNREEICKNMTENNPSTTKFKKIEVPKIFEEKNKETINFETFMLIQKRVLIMFWLKRAKEIIEDKNKIVVKIEKGI